MFNKNTNSKRKTTPRHIKPNTFLKNVKKHQQSITEETKMRNTLYDQARKEGIKEGIAIGAEQGEQRKAASIITNMLRKGKSPEEIADMTGEELEKIREIQKQLL